MDIKKIANAWITFLKSKGVMKTFFQLPVEERNKIKEEYHSSKKTAKKEDFEELYKKEQKSEKKRVPSKFKSEEAPKTQQKIIKKVVENLKKKKEDK